MAEIVDAAWELSRANGLGNFSMRELGTRVGMRAQSLYSYFTSKHEIYDAMFLDGNRALLEALAPPVATDGERAEDPASELKRAMRRFFEFCLADPVRYQLLFQRTIPEFEPSSASYGVAQEAYDAGVGSLRSLGLTQADLDLATALMVGMVSQQLSNEPEGDRWRSQLDRAMEMLLAELAPEALATPGRKQ